MASVKSMIAAGLLAAPCAEAFVAPGGSQSSQAVSGLRGSTAVKAESGFSTSALAISATTGAAVLSFVGAKKFSPEAQIGVTEPLGFFDPAGFCKDEASFKDLRAKELKHGRLAMMGALGMLTQSLVQLPGMEGVPKDISAFSTGAGQTGFLITIAIIAVLEAAVFVQDDSKEPGNFGNPLPLVGDDYSDEMRNREINNGRIAMFAALGQIAAGLYTGKSAIEQFGL
ncbi:FCPF [Symbiodinium sp. CCMP2592]|nr:FCPF [Symbiodinium sp. CCMP2592]